MLRGIFMSPKATKDQVDYYVDLFKKVRETPEWKDFMKSGAFNTTFMTGADYAKWVETRKSAIEALMKDAGSSPPETDRSAPTTDRPATQSGPLDRRPIRMGFS